MNVAAHLTNAKMAPRKVRWLRQAVLGLPVREARAQLTWQSGKAAELVLGVLNSAVANAEHNYELSADNLRVAGLDIGEGASLKRFQPVSRGMAHPFVKRFCHITVTVGEITATPGEKRAGRKSEIATVSIEDVAAEAQGLEEKITDTDEPNTSARVKPENEESLKAYQKKKMQQQGGDVHKTHRRKSA